MIYDAYLNIFKYKLNFIYKFFKKDLNIVDKL